MKIRINSIPIFSIIDDGENKSLVFEETQEKGNLLVDVEDAKIEGGKIVSPFKMKIIPEKWSAFRVEKEFICQKNNDGDCSKCAFCNRKPICNAIACNKEFYFHSFGDVN